MVDLSDGFHRKDIDGGRQSFNARFNAPAASRMRDRVREQK
jgi:hypothetical protein